MLRTEFLDFTAVSQHRTDAEKGDSKNMVVSVGILIDDQVVATTRNRHNARGRVLAPGLHPASRRNDSG
jgi:hypothetical protein